MLLSFCVRLHVAFIIRYQLEIKKSEYITLTGESVNNALVGRILIPKKTKFSIFCNGEIISDFEYNKRRLKGKGGYGHYFGKGKIYDSYRSAKLGNCMASMGNNALNLVHSRTGKKAVNNADLIYNNKRLYLVSRKKDILPGEEIFYPYGKTYSRKDYIS